MKKQICFYLFVAESGECNVIPSCISIGDILRFRHVSSDAGKNLCKKFFIEEEI